MYKLSHSRVECFNDCPYKYKLKYLNKWTTIKNQDPNNPLYLGSAIHTGIENGVESALNVYLSEFYVINDENIDEIIKIDYLLNKINKMNLKGEFERELKVDFSHDVFGKKMDFQFTGYIDYISKNKDGTVDIYDFKYSNNVEKYRDSSQLHLYKYFLEKSTNMKVRNMYFYFIPKSFAKIRKTETQYQFRQRIVEELKEQNFKILEIKYDESKVTKYLIDALKMIHSDIYKKTGSYCDWCEYKDYCQKGEDLEMLPSIERVEIKKEDKKKIWLYGAPFTGKTTVADQSPTPLNLNTDGNVKYVTMPRIPIKDVITQTGRMTNRKFAWEVFEEAISDLEKGSDFETIVVDLLEDEYEYCRLYMYNQLGITHESDDSFRAWDKVRTKFISTVKRLLNLDYNIILISHEDTSKDMAKKSGDKITAIKPNIQDKIANKIAGMVDIVARVVAEDDGARTLNLKANEVIFGGGRLKGISTTQTELSWEAIEQLYDEAIGSIKTTKKKEKVEESKEEPLEGEIIEEDQPLKGEIVEEKPKRTRRTRKTREGEND